MDDYQAAEERPQSAKQTNPSAFVFEGNWIDFAKIAIPNLLLTILTLGIYRFWATTRERKYLWSQSQFIDEPLEWRGTGLELFIGFILVLLLIGLPFLFLQFGMQALVLQNQEAIASVLALVSFTAIFYFVGLARFRALRYRLSRTYWRGIRGGSNNPGFGYGWSYIWKNFVGYAAFGFLIPWSMTSLWDERWRQMSFGPHRFESNADFGNIFLRYLIFYFSPILILIALVVFGVFFAGIFVALDQLPEILGSSNDDGSSSDYKFLAILLIFGLVIIGYFIFGLIFLIYYSAFYREAVGAMTLYDLEFGFSARTKDWIVLYVVDALLVFFTFGLGWIFLSYRHWKFFISHMQCYGEIDVAQLTQSETSRAGHGEGLLDAFDVGAI